MSIPEGTAEISNNPEVQIHASPPPTLSAKEQAIATLEREMKFQEQTEQEAENTRYDNVKSLDDISDEYVYETKGLNPAKELENVPENVKKLYMNLKADYTKKTQQIAEERKALASERSKMEALFKTYMNSDVYKQQEQDAAYDGEVDPFNPETVTRAIKAEAAKVMRQQAETFQQEFAKKERLLSIEKFKADRPDFDTHKVEMYKILSSNPNVKFEDAYYITKARKAEVEAAKAKEEQDVYHSEVINTISKIGGVSKNRDKGGVPEEIRKQGAVAIFRYLEKKQAK